MKTRRPLNMKPPTPESEQYACDEWNKSFPVGTPVNVKRDDGSTTETKTRSEAWLMGGHTAVISVEGISGGYMLNRVRPR